MAQYEVAINRWSINHTFCDEVPFPISGRIAAPAYSAIIQRINAQFSTYRRLSIVFAVLVAVLSSVNAVILTRVEPLSRLWISWLIGGNVTLIVLIIAYAVIFQRRMRDFQTFLAQENMNIAHLGFSFVYVLMVFNPAQPVSYHQAPPQVLYGQPQQVYMMPSAQTDASASLVQPVYVQTGAKMV